MYNTEKMTRKKLNIHDLKRMKKNGEPVAWVTSYDYITAQLAEQAGIDMILVGDSLGMCVYGYDNTIPVTLDQCLYHCEAVRRAAPNTFVIGDMPFGSYQCGTHKAIESAIKFHKIGGVDALKLEGGKSMTKVIKGITDNGMLVMGHLGLTPQSASSLGGFKAQGLTVESAMSILEDARALCESGAFAILIEAVPPEVTKIIRDELPIPIYSIGAGVHADGQLMIVSDIVGYFQSFTPKFVKKYGNVSGEITKSLESFIKEVREKNFPDENHSYKMKDGEANKLSIKDWRRAKN